MNSHSHAITNSFWLRETPLPQRFERLEGSHATEMLVIGAGITGLSIALELRSRGHDVTVCDAETIGAGTTGASSGHVDAHPEMGATELQKRLGDDAAAAYISMRRRAIDTIEQRAGDDCDFVRVPGFRYSTSSDDRHELEQQCAAAAKIGLDTQWADEIPIAGAACGYRVNSMARMDCGKYLRRLTDLAVQQGVRIFEKTLVTTPTENHPQSLDAGGGKVHFKKAFSAVHCNHTPSLMLYAATPPYQSYVIAAQVRNVPDDALFWDNSDPYYYVRRANSSDPSLLLVGGCDHRTGHGDELGALQRLEGWIEEHLGVKEIVHRWSAELFEPVDGLPMIGLAPGSENVWIATGLSGVGLTLGTAAGEMLADLAEGKPVPLEDPLSPSRTGLSSPVNWLREQVTTAGNYAKRILPSEKIDTSSLSKGQGRVGSLEGKHAAVCVDRQGCEHRLNPKCSHMGGVVQWNEAEQTWDCPAHGGRFTASGERIYGPPESKLTPLGE